MPRPQRERLDVLLVERGLAESRTRAQALILAGRVRSGEQRLDKPGARFPSDLPLVVDAGRLSVSRGGPKLEAALRAFGVDPTGRDALDVGASTGGFTEALLRGGAARVIALDVGHGQLDWSLRRDPRVVVLDGVNARHLRPSDLPFRPSLATIDVAFISLDLVLPPVAACVGADPGDVVALVKPQFEVGRGRVGRGGVVRDEALHREVLQRIVDRARGASLRVSGVAPSPILGSEGNREFFLHVVTGVPPSPASAPIAQWIDAALAARPPSH